MEDFQRDGVAHEAKFFLLRTRLNPYFLARHVLSLGGIIFDKYSSKFLTKWRGRHFGNKSIPAWLCQMNNGVAGVQGDVTRIPYFNFGSKTLVKSTATPYLLDHDHENYLARYRWSECIDDCFSGVEATELPATVLDFIVKPLPKTDAAWETYSTCERIANSLLWIAAIPVTEREKIVPPAYFAFLQDSLVWVKRHLEYYRDKTGNHILNNARVLVMAGVVLNDQHAITSGLEIFKRMLPVLVQPEGSLRERSSHYQLIVLTWLLDAYQFLTPCQDADTDFLKHACQRMRDTAALLCDEEGSLQVFVGDISPDLSPQKTVARLKACYPDWWPVQRNTASKIIRDDWRLLQNEKNKIVINCPAGCFPQPFSSHAHNDLGSFVWLYHDMPVFIDIGRARYTKDDVSTRQKSARGHNLPLVNAFAPLCESLVVSGNWWPVPYARAHVKMEELANGVIISHDGYQRATPVQQHRRTITMEPQQIRVCDQFSGKGQVKIDILWHLNPAAAVKNNNITINNLDIEMDASNTLMAPRIQILSDNWHATEYGSADRHSVMMMSWEVTLPFTADIIFKVIACAV